VIDCRECDPTTAQPRYPPTTAGDHVVGRFNAAFAYRNR
jgi:hypothetical protein